MQVRNTPAALVLGALLAAGFTSLGYLLSDGLVRFKSLDRTVTVKGLSEREVPADIAIWPIRFDEADNELAGLYANIQRKAALVVEYLKKAGFTDAEISAATPAIVDRHAQAYGETDRISYRYTGSYTVTVYSQQVERVRSAMQGLVELGKKGVVIAGQDYGVKTEFLFTGLNDIKPAMIEEATRAAREVATKFAQDSASRMGKIRQASQGQFSIEDRDSNTPHIKKVRVVSTVEYYLSD